MKVPFVQLKQLWPVKTWTWELWESPVVTGTRAFYSGSSNAGAGRIHGGWGLHGSDLLQHVLQMLDLIGIWGIWRPGRHTGLFIMFLELLMSIVCRVSGHIIYCHRVVLLWWGGCSWFTTVFGWVVSIKWHSHECQHLRFPSGSMLFTSPVSGFNKTWHNKSAEMFFFACVLHIFTHFHVIVFFHVNKNVDN